ncbi:cystathionine beta-synthase (beta-thionase) [Aspergillus arachidicola]|uniref:Cystathionine beta-synthase (Beta-thionase) n=1 Tax=Aspergillus arachidicola TaxID=656916 RepID=A0A2G7FWT2_9EURO|nr:cystathionine beta-synthase (beta-thionase) [Aspergillus arachidicola]
MAFYSTGSEAFAREKLSSTAEQSTSPSSWADKYRGATVEDLDPPPALSVSPNDLVSSAMLAAYERDFTHLTQLLKEGTIKESDSVSAAMQRFNRKRGLYQVITMETPLEELEQFFETETGPNGEKREKQEFAVVTDASRKFVLGVVTKGDLEEFVKRRP